MESKLTKDGPTEEGGVFKVIFILSAKLYYIIDQ